MRSNLGILASITGLIASPVTAGEFAGFVALEGRAFVHAEASAGQRSSGISALLEPEYYHESDNGNDTFVFRPFLRVDQYDAERTHADIRELHWTHAQDNWEFRAGIGKEFWGVAESVHLIDIINQTDLLEDIDGEEKLGQPLLYGSYITEWGQLQAYILPGFRSRTFPGEAGRLRGPLVVNTDNAEYESSAAENNIDLAFRYRHSFDAYDVGLYHFYGTNRAPRFRVENNQLIPRYDLIHQTGLELQATFDAWLWKLEAAFVSGQGFGTTYDYAAYVGGFEYSFFQVNDTAIDVGLLAEHQFSDAPSDAPQTPADNNLFLGTRIALNDVASTELLAGGVVDLRDASTSLFTEYQTRLNDHVTFTIDARFFFSDNADNDVFALRRDDVIQAQLAYYF